MAETSGDGNLTEKTNRRSALGRGLGALMGDKNIGDGTQGRRVLEVPIEQLFPKDGQPRTVFDEKGIEELAISVREKGVISPVLVKRKSKGKDKGYSIIAGERRWRAAQKAGLKTVPVLVEDVDEDDAFELALIENIQRQDLNPLEEANAYHQLMKRRGWTQDQLGEHLGKDRSSVANSLRLRKLPESVRCAVTDGKLAMGHARALAALSDENEMEKAARRIISRGLSVRQAEEIVRAIKKSKDKTDSKSDKQNDTPEVRDLIQRLEQSLATRCRLNHKKGKGGRITIEYESLDDLDRIINQILGS